MRTVALSISIAVLAAAAPPSALAQASVSTAAIQAQAMAFQQCIASEFVRQIKRGARLNEAVCNRELVRYRTTLLKAGFRKKDAERHASTMRLRTVLTVKQVILAATLFPENF